MTSPVSSTGSNSFLGSSSNASASDFSFPEFLKRKPELQHISLHQSPLTGTPLYVLHWGEPDHNDYFLRACYELSQRGTDRVQGYLSRLPPDIMSRVLKVFLCGIQFEESQLLYSRVPCPAAAAWEPAVFEAIENGIDAVESEADKLDLLFLEGCVRVVRAERMLAAGEKDSDNVKLCKTLSGDLFKLTSKFADCSDHSPRIFQFVMTAADCP